MVIVPSRSSNDGLHTMLQDAVQTVQWTYNIFWQLCPQQGILVWSDGYYNGAIKTRKTVQPTEMSTEEASLQRSQQLKELYESLSSGETNHHTRGPSTALSPEDLTETEWFYLMCISFSFPPEVGLPGRAYARGHHIWLSGVNEVERKVFSRAILAKSAKIQTVVCIPLLDGVVELGTTERVKEDLGLIQRIKSFFIDVEINPSPPKPALSEHSTSNQPTSFNNISAMLPPCATVDPALIHNSYVTEDQLREQDEATADSDEEEGRDGNIETEGGAAPATRELSQLMQLDNVSEDIRLGAPDDGSNNVDPNIHLIAVSRMTDSAEHHRRIDMSRAELIHSLKQQSQNGFPSIDELNKEDTRYSHTVSTILQNHPGRTSNSSFSTISSAFSKYSATSPGHHLLLDGASQWSLKYLLFTVPFLHSKSINADTKAGFSRGTTHQEELSANHVLAERRRREKINERFIILRSLVPCVTKMDKASILGDTIEYLKQLRKKIQELEIRAVLMEVEKNNDNNIVKEQNRENTSWKGKRKQRINVEGNGGDCGSGGKSIAAWSLPQEVATQELVQVEVSIIERDALIEIQCLYKEGLLLDVMLVLRTLRIEATAVQSSIINGVFTADIRAKVKENVNAKKASIMEVKRAINQMILQ